MRKQFLALALILGLLLTGCGGPGADPGSSSSPSSNPSAAPSSGISEGSSTVIDTNSAFTDRDYETGYEESKSAFIYLNGDSATCSSNAVQISGSTVTITDEGTYVISGTLNDGMIIVNSEKTDKTQLVLDNVTIHSETSAPIYILQSDKVFITLTENSSNALSNGGSFLSIDENNIDSVIFSKEDLTLNGSGSLTISSPAGHAIVSKDELTITGGTYELTTSSHAITGKDNICIADASMTISSGKDGIHAENDEDASLGYLYIQNGVFDISAEGDGLSAGSTLQIDNGTFYILTGGGSENGQQQTSDAWGNMGGGMGGPGGMGGGMGGRPGGRSSSGTTTTEDDSTSIKGIKASAGLVINGGSFVIDSADDAVHSNGSLTVNGGTFDIETGDDGFHADETLSITNGTISVTESYEGLEGLHVLVSGGNIRLVTTDDGLNAAGGTDSSGMGGYRGNDMFGGSSNGSIVISGGSLYVNASGDGIDANGYLEITGGCTVVVGPTIGDTATLDYDTTATISGGTFIGTGSSMMAQTFSDSLQGVIAVSVGNQSAGTQITLTDEAGNPVISHTPELDFAVVILSSPDIIKGENYTITVGANSGTFEAN